MSGHSKQSDESREFGDGLAVMRFSEIDAPGTYLVEPLGWLLRVPPDALVVGRSPSVSLTAKEPVSVSRISHDPWIPISRAKAIAAQHARVVGF